MDVARKEYQGAEWRATACRLDMSQAGDKFDRVAPGAYRGEVTAMRYESPARVGDKAFAPDRRASLSIDTEIFGVLL
jgi:hypothetical protein